MAWRKKITGTGIAAGALAGLVAFAAAPAAQATTYHDEAFGLQVNLAGDPIVGPVPYVSSEDGTLQKEKVAAIPSGNQNATPWLQIDAKTLNAGVLEVAAKGGWAQSTVTHLNVGSSGAVRAQVVRSTCTKAKGAVNIIDLELLDNVIIGSSTNPAPNTKFGVPGLLTITLNEQTKNADGSLTVNAAHVEILPGLSGSQATNLVASLDAQGLLRPSAGLTSMNDLTGMAAKSADKAVSAAKSNAEKVVAGDSGALVDVVLASATCDTNAPPIESPSPTPSESDTGGDDNGDNGDNGDEAPAPTPVHTNAPVTG